MHLDVSIKPYMCPEVNILGGKVFAVLVYNSLYSQCDLGL